MPAVGWVQVAMQLCEGGVQMHEPGVVGLGWLAWCQLAAPSGAAPPIWSVGAHLVVNLRPVGVCGPL